MYPHYIPPNCMKYEEIADRKRSFALEKTGAVKNVHYGKAVLTARQCLSLVPCCIRGIMLLSKGVAASLPINGKLELTVGKGS